MNATPRLRFILILAAIVALGPLSIDMYLPSLPAIGRALNANASSVQMTVSAYFAGLAIGQLIYGPISDRFGRRGPLLFGLIVYVLSSMGCALAGSVEALIALRFVQALGGCAGMVITRALLRDHFSGDEMARMLSTLVLVMGVAPILAPTIGGQLQQGWGWQSTFWVLAAYGVFCIGALVMGIAEPQRERASSLGFGSVAADYLRIMRHRRFMGYTFAGGCVQAGMFAYITASPFVFIEHFGLALNHYGWLFGGNAAGLILGSQLNRYVLSRFRAEKVLRTALAAYGLAAIVMISSAITHIGGLWGIALPLLVCLTSLGFTFPNAQAAAMEPFAARAGTASALMGTVQFGLAGLSSIVVSHLNTSDAVGMSAIILICAVCGQIALRVLVRPPAIA
jgi:DHA1 family bicyclomycin/chloramphenicol resistance-like MFS transporter